MTFERISLLRISLISFSLLIAFPSNAEDYLVLGESSVPSSISGFAGTEKKINVGEFGTTYENFGTGTQAHGSDTHTVTTYAGIKGITWYEDKDKPCKIHVDAKELVSGLEYGDSKTPAAANDGDFNICKGSPGNAKSVKFSIRDYYVRAIQACTTDKKNSDDNRLKGIRIYIAQVKSDGSVIALDNYEQDKHTNCNDKYWRKKVSCPAGYIASGIKVHHRDGYFTGLGLKCRRLGVRSYPHKS